MGKNWQNHRIFSKKKGKDKVVDIGGKKIVTTPAGTIPPKMSQILSNRATPIHLSEAELLFLRTNHKNQRKIWPGILSWFRVRNHPSLQIAASEKFTAADAEIVWQDRKKIFLEGYNAAILMNDTNTILVQEKDTEKLESGIEVPTKKVVQKPAILI